MKLAKEPKEIDFVIKSEPWTEKDLADFSLLIKEIKLKNKRRKSVAKTRSIRKNSSEKIRVKIS
ncbi:MAG: hypothetical protein LUM44_24290 [Pyrinomonadaceae bacterium]|nr:hypothetical protein [Pyrinomonadaceae bacterium]